VVRVASTAAALLVAMQAALGPAASVAAAEDNFEYQLKAEFIERFTRFVDWPQDANGEGGRAAFVIGVVGESAIYDHLADIVGQRKIKGRQAELLTVTDLDQVAKCDLVFIAPAASEQLPTILSRTEGLAILTVSDSEGFGERGVLINLFREGEYLRFEINRNAVSRSGLRFSSNLLRLARLVE
jgi:hypothetical protein